MTVVPAVESSTLTLVCDGCGYALKDIDSRPANWPVVWAVVSEHGWGGSPLMIGPHRCPRCAGTVSPDAATDQNAAPTINGWTFTLADEEHACVVGLRGHLDIVVANPLRDVLTEALQRHRNVVLDVGDVRTVDSTALGLLVRARQEARHRNGHLCLVAPSRFIVAVLHTMRLLPAFNVFPNTPAALAWLAAAPVDND